jgi:murein DD-endopeptidase MepM/ murein hydrolase activator NlpD
MTLKNFFITLLIVIAFVAGQEIISAASSTGRTSICVGQCPRSELGCWPVGGNVSQGVGGGFSHPGSTAIDISGNGGQPIHASVNGNARMVGGECGTYVEGRDSGWGCAVELTIDTGTYAGYRLYFAHMQCTNGTCVVPTGNITAGTLLGYVNDTGHSTGNHLHYEIRNPDGTKIAPGTIPQEVLLNAEQTLCAN